jgi:DNA-binding NarL/FixJ family response regulator
MERSGAMGTGDGSTDVADTRFAGSLHVLLVEDDPHAAHVVARDFRRSGVAVTVARTLADARAFLHGNPTDLDAILLDLRLPDGRGESLLPDIEACSPQPAVIITSAFLSELQADALEYRPTAVPKPVTTQALLRMVRVVAEGYARPVIKRFIQGFDLSKREAEAVALVVQGLKPKEIAESMHCSEKTVYAHLARVCEKTCSHDYHEVVGKVFAFACHTVGHSREDHETFVGAVRPAAPRR